jgi:hypothetical protein
MAVKNSAATQVRTAELLDTLWPRINSRNANGARSFQVLQGRYLSNDNLDFYAVL